MEPIPEASQVAFTRRPTVASRFNEQFSGTSSTVTPESVVHIVKHLKQERDRHKKHKFWVFRRSAKYVRKPSRQRTRRSSTAPTFELDCHRSIARTMVEKHMTAKSTKQKHEAEHRAKHRLTGAMWSYDPMARRLADTVPSTNDFQGCYIFQGIHNDSDEYGGEEIDVLGRRTGRLWLNGSKWGIESGGPSRQAAFDPVHTRNKQRGNTSAMSRKRTCRESYNPWVSRRSLSV